MTAENQQIVTAYETLGMDAEAIASAMGFETFAVKAILNQESPAYRAALKSNDKTAEFDDNDEAVALDTIRYLAKNAEDDGIRLNAAKYLRNDKKGRLDVKRDIRSMNFSITLLNGHMQQAMAALNKVRQIGNTPVTEATVDV
jgi:hypothetical protein